MMNRLAFASILFLYTFTKLTTASNIIYEQHSSLSCSSTRAATSYFWKTCQDGFYAKFLQSYEATCPGARRRRNSDDKQLSKQGEV